MLINLNAIASKLAVATLVSAGLLAAATTPAAATTFTVPPSEVHGDVGDIVLIGNDGRQLSSGDGSTRFLVRPPDGASCPGDSANDQWRVSTFLIPVNEDPLDVVFGSSGPEPPWIANRYPLFDNQDSLPIVFNMLRRNPAPGSPGLIESIPETSFTMLAQNLFPGGRYRMGIACSYFAQTTQYWDTEIELAAAPDGKDSQLAWTLPNAPTPPPAEDAESSLGLWIVIGSIGAALVVAIVIWRSRGIANRQQARRHDESVGQYL